MKKVVRIITILVSPTATWVLVTALGYGPQSLANLIELPIVLGVSTFLLFVPDQFLSFKVKVVILVTGVILLRTLMPVIPE